MIDYIRKSFKKVIYFIQGSFLIYFFISGRFLLAQEFHFHKFTEKDGLAGSAIFCIQQDKHGFMWFGTDMGVSRFDGKTFENFSPSEGAAGYGVELFFQDARKRLWMQAQNNKVTIFDPASQRFLTEKNDTALSVINQYKIAGDIFIDNNGRIWFLNDEQYLFYEPKSKQVTEVLSGTVTGTIINGTRGPLLLLPKNNKALFYSNNKLDSVPQRYFVENYSPSVWRDKDGSIVFFSFEGLIRQKDTNQQLIFPFHNSLNNIRPSFLRITRNKQAWIGTYGNGIYIFDLNHPEKPPVNLCPGKPISEIFEDAEGNIWFAVINEFIGMIPYTARDTRVYRKHTQANTEQCHSVLSLGNGKVFAGFNQGKMSVFENETETELEVPGLPQYLKKQYNRIFCSVRHQNDIWIGTRQLGLIHYNPEKGCFHIVECFHEQTKVNYKLWAILDMFLGMDSLYFIGYGDKPVRQLFSVSKSCSDGHHAISRPSYVLNNTMSAIYVDGTNWFWIGTDKGLYRVKHNNKEWLSVNNPILKSEITHINEAQGFGLLVGTMDSGVYVLRDNKVAYRFDISKGLCHNQIRKIKVHGNDVFIVTASGVSYFQLRNRQMLWVKNFTKGNYLGSSNTYDLDIDDKSIYVAGFAGISIIPVSELYRKHNPVPKLAIVSVYLGDSNITVLKSPAFNYGFSRLKISYKGFYFQEPDAVNYRYRLKENEPWNYTKVTEIEIPGLRHGKYHFQVQSRIHSGPWSPVRSYHFEIRAPFWLSNGFIILVILVITGLVYLIVRARIQRINKINKIKLAALSAELQALRSQLNPHFIFNALNSIHEYVLQNDPQKASRYLTDFASLMRTILEFSRSELITLNEELNFLKKYLTIEQLRFLRKFDFQFEISPEINIEECEIHSMLLQPFVENAILHGISGISDKGLLTIRFKKEDKKLIVDVEDNGIGYSGNNENKKKRESMALKIFQDRIAKFEISGEEILYTFTNLASPQRGTKVSLIFNNYFE